MNEMVTSIDIDCHCVVNENSPQKQDDKLISTILFRERKKRFDWMPVMHKTESSYNSGSVFTNYSSERSWSCSPDFFYI